MGDCLSTLAVTVDDIMNNVKPSHRNHTQTTKPTNHRPAHKVDPASQAAVDQLQRFLQINGTAKIQEQPFASVALTAQDAQKAQELLWQHHTQRVRQERAAEMANQQVTFLRANGTPITMQYWAKLYHPANSTQPPHNPIPLFIGLHGGGGCPPHVNNSQWENHKRIYDRTYQQVANATQSSLLYIAPRAPTNNWNLWHEPHMDGLLDRLIETMVACRNVDSNRVYISGYSAGGDGVYMLAPRMADRWAAASMMAGHPNGVSLRGVYNLPFSLHVGGKDAPYNRNTVARAYKKGLEHWKEQEAAHGGYQQIWAKIYEDKAHGLGGQDAVAMGWMARHTRNATPSTLVWDMGSARHARFYWVLRSNNCGGGEIRVIRRGNQVVIDLTKCPNPEQIAPITFRFNDAMVDTDKPVAIYRQDGNGRKLLQELRVRRTIGALTQTLAERGDPNAIYNAQVKVDVQDTQSPPKRLRGN